MSQARFTLFYNIFDNFWPLMGNFTNNLMPVGVIALSHCHLLDETQPNYLINYNNIILCSKV